MRAVHDFDPRLGEQLYPPHNRKLEPSRMWEVYKDYYAQTVDCLTTTNNIPTTSGAVQHDGDHSF
jgi:hypothetical protein